MTVTNSAIRFLDREVGCVYNIFSLKSISSQVISYFATTAVYNFPTTCRHRFFHLSEIPSSKIYSRLQDTDAYVSHTAWYCHRRFILEKSHLSHLKRRKFWHWAFHFPYKDNVCHLLDEHHVCIQKDVAIRGLFVIMWLINSITWY